MKLGSGLAFVLKPKLPNHLGEVDSSVDDPHPPGHYLQTWAVDLGIDVTYVSGETPGYTNRTRCCL